MTTYTMIGTIVEIGEVSVFGRDNDRRRRRFFIADQESPNPKFPSVVSFDIEDDNCSLLDGLPNRALVEVSFTIQGVRYKGKDGEWKRFNKILATAIRPAGEAPYAAPARPAPAAPAASPMSSAPTIPAPAPTRAPGTLPDPGSPYMPQPHDADEAMPF